MPKAFVSMRLSKWRYQRAQYVQTFDGAEFPMNIS